MSLSTGTRLGPYEIVELVGAGGMGEVYKARDPRLDRVVAVKVLPKHLSSSEEIRQRFEREAKAISQLSHPHVCALYDVGTHEGTEYLVMEFLEGETLADRLGRGPLPMEQVLRYGIEITDALDKAHRAGIVHRDLKPGNVMLTKGGVKLLDFGLAKLHAAAAQQALSDVSRLATEARQGQPMTEKGTVLGTFQYMAPEQLEGGEADARSDIFALGAVLYEMATGRKAFAGKSQASLIGSILRDDPPSISEIAPMTPPAFNRVVKTCLAKDPEDRFQTAHDVKLQLAWVAEGGSQAGVPAPIVTRRKNREKLAWAVAAVLGVAAALFAYGFLRRAPAPPRAVRFEIATPPEVATIDAPRISPDGRLLAFNATGLDGKNRIWVRPLNALAAHPLDGTEGTTRPFWSPDSRYIGFFAEGKLKKIDASGGPAQKICDAPSGADGSWSARGVILFDGVASDPIRRVSAAGGTPVVAVKADPARKESGVAWPEFLPDGKHFLYMAMAQKAEESVYRVGSLDSTESKSLVPAQTLVTYAPPGYLVFVRDRTLVAQGFDAASLKTTGEPVPVAEHVGTGTVGLARFSVSRQGTLVYRTGETLDRLLWVDRAGHEIETIGDPGDYSNPAFSPAGDRLAYNSTDSRSGKSEIWIRDLARGVNSRFTFTGKRTLVPLWSPDGQRLVFSVTDIGPLDLYEKPSDGQGEEKLLLKSDETKIACDWSRDGRYIAYMSLGKETAWDIWILPLFGDRKPFAFLKTPFPEGLPAFSPDGRYIAYQSAESGRAEVYVRSFPGAGGKWQVSTAGGQEAHWSADGKELFYRAPDQKVMSVEIQTANGFTAGVPKQLFQGRFETGPARARYLPARDGRRFLLSTPLAREAITPTTVVLNWFADLGR
jgi:Tol biopolymer transport system component/tRNA A-37 threonylcarbamoyl transferase component Bud32